MTPDVSFGPVVGVGIPVGRLLLIHLKKEEEKHTWGLEMQHISSPHESLCG
jgi:hypothetical protein